jgi:hypothetical protein
MARAGLLGFEDAVFEKDGKQIPYRTVSLTPAGRATDETTPVAIRHEGRCRPGSQSQVLEEGPEIEGVFDSRISIEIGETRKSGCHDRAGAESHRTSTARMALEVRPNAGGFRHSGFLATARCSVSPRSRRAMKRSCWLCRVLGRALLKKYGAHIFRLW